MSTILTSQIILQDIQRMLVNNTVLASKVNRQYSDQFAKRGAKKGDTVSIRKPVKNTVQDGEVASLGDTEEKSTSIVVDQRKHVILNFQNKDLTLSIDNFRELYLKEPVADLGNAVDAALAGLYKDIPSFTGIPGTAATTTATYLNAGAAMDDQGVPRMNRNVVVDPWTNAGLVESVKGLNNPPNDIGGMLKKGQVARNFLGLDWWMDQNIKRHTVGAVAGTPLVNQTSFPEGATEIVTDGWSNSITGLLKKGDIISFAGVYALKGRGGESTGRLKQFVVTADVNSGASTGPATIPVYPAFISSGPYANITAQPVNNAAIYVYDKAAANLGDITGQSSAQGMIFHPDAFTLAMVDLEPLGAGTTSERLSDPETGISILLTQGSDILAFRQIWRLDILFGVKTIYPELAHRVVSN